jgi:hypothetical protein
MNPLSILRESIRAVPAVKYALGIAGIVSAVAIIGSFGLDYRVTVVGTVLMFFLMATLVVFARLSALAAPDLRVPALVFTWFSLLLVMAVGAALFSSVFFQWPIDLGRWLDGSTKAVFPRSADTREVPRGDPQPQSVPRGQDPAVTTTAPEAVKPAAKKQPVPPAMDFGKIFEQIRGQWQSNQKSEREIFYSPGALGRCVAVIHVRSVVTINELEGSTGRMNGDFENAVRITARFTPPGGMVPDEVPREGCRKSTVGDPDADEVVIRGKGLLAIEPQGNAREMRVVLTVTDCERGGRTCSAEEFGEKSMDAERLGSGVLKIGDNVYRRP